MFNPLVEPQSDAKDVANSEAIPVVLSWLLFQGQLSQDQIKKLSSEYLTEGAFQDHFKINSVEIDGFSLKATASITSFGVSPTDEQGYHLTAPSVFRILAQLAVIHGHALFGFDEKSVEVWAKEYHAKHSRPVRDPKNMSILFQIQGMRPARSNPKMLGFHYTVNMGDGAVTADGTAFYDLSKKPPSDLFLRAIGMRSLASVK